jgi:hypothetical protein
MVQRDGKRARRARSSLARVVLDPRQSEAAEERRRGARKDEGRRREAGSGRRRHGARRDELGADLPKPRDDERRPGAPRALEPDPGERWGRAPRGRYAVRRPDPAGPAERVVFRRYDDVRGGGGRRRHLKSKAQAKMKAKARKAKP